MAAWKCEFPNIPVLVCDGEGGDQFLDDSLSILVRLHHCSHLNGHKLWVVTELWEILGVESLLF